MARTGTFGGFPFDPEVFSQYMTEQPTWSNAILASGILTQDPTIMNLIGTDGNVATLPFYKPITIEENDALNNDGETNNEPVEISGSKQTCMLIQRMKAWKSKDFTKELTQADPLQHVANSVNNYYEQVWIKEMMGITDAILGVSELASHITDIAEGTGAGEVKTENKIDETTLIYAQQKALGDMADGFGLFVINSMIFAKYKAMGLVDYNKYTITNALERDITLPTIGGLIPIVMDRYTIDTTQTNAKYKSYIIGQGAFLTCDKTNYENPYYTDYDPETVAGVEKLYTKQGKVLHPNGLSLKVANISKESPTTAELSNKSNWELAFDPKNIRIGMIVSNG